MAREVARENVFLGFGKSTRAKKFTGGTTRLFIA